MFDWVGEKISQFSDWLLSIFQSFLDWVLLLVNKIFETVVNAPEFFYQKFCELIVEFFDAIPVPDFMSSAGTAFSSIPSGVLFYASAFQLGYGISVVLAAYTLRFLIRRIPIIG